MTVPTRIDVDSREAAAYIPVAKRFLARLRAALPLGGARYYEFGSIKMNLWWTQWIDKIRITSAAGGFLVLIDHAEDEVFEGWGFTGGVGVKLVDIPRANEWALGDGNLSRYFRGEDHAAGYSFTADTSDEAKFGWRVSEPYRNGFLRVPQSGLPPLFIEPRTRSYSGGKFLYGGGGTTNLYSFGDPGLVPTVDLPEDLGETELGGTLSSRDTQFLPNGNLQYAARREVTAHANLFVQEWDVNFEGEIVTPGTPETLDDSRNYRGGVSANQSAIGPLYSTPVTLGAVGRLSLDFAGNPDVHTFRQAGGGDYSDTAVRTVGMPVWIASGHLGGNNPVMIADDPIPETVTMQPGSVVLHDDTLNLSGDAYMCFVHAYPVYHEGFDYWHVYTASAKPTISSPTGLADFDVGYPLTVTLTFRVVRSDGAVMHTTIGGWTQTDGIPSYSGIPGTFKVYYPLGMADGWIAGGIIEFGPGITTTITPAQWTPDLVMVHRYDGFSFNESAGQTAGAASPRTIMGEALANWYVAADASGTYFVVLDNGTAHGVEVGSSGGMEKIVTPADQDSTYVAPHSDVFNFFTTARS